ncbi:GNAT family N-acetyltransferase [Paenibacillus wenxiniae]|uniref:GNAT family N-acetyltransferase n=1 Tax=Paenibacillus wenxiniae TaxID=1636843 RepID=A0ABW4RH85_9BACL
MLYPSFLYSVRHGIIRGTIDCVNPNYTNRNDDNIHITDSAIAANCEYNWFYVGGNPADRAFFKQKLDTGWLKQMNDQPTAVIFSQNEQWDAMIEAEMKGMFQPMKRYAFVYEQSDAGQAAEMARQAEQRLPDGYKLATITPSVIQKSRGFDEKYIKRFWQTMDNYVQHGFGFCILYEGQSVCECITIAANPDCAEVDIHTAATHQRKGLAFVVAQAFIAESVRRGIRPRWDCNAANEASAGLAHKLGFRPTSTYRMWIKS